MQWRRQDFVSGGIGLASLKRQGARAHVPTSWRRHCYWAFTRSDRRTDRSVRLVCPTSRMKRLHVPIVGPTSRTDGLSDRSVRRSERVNAHLKWSCEAGGGGSPDEARLEQTPYPFHTQLIWHASLRLSSNSVLLMLLVMIACDDVPCVKPVSV